MNFKIIQVLLLLAFQLIEAAPYQLAWLRIRSDKSIGSQFVWTEFNVRRGETMQSVLESKFGGPRDSSLEKDLHLYKMIPIDLSKTVEELGLDPSGENLYLTDENIMDR